MAYRPDQGSSAGLPLKPNPGVVLGVQRADLAAYAVDACETDLDALADPQEWPDFQISKLRGVELLLTVRDRRCWL